MNTNFLKIAFIVCAMVGSLVFSSMNVDAKHVRKNVNQSDFSSSNQQFSRLANNSSIDQIGASLGKPDEIQTLKNTLGDQVGLVWVYNNVMQKNGDKKDVQLVFIDNKLQYTSLSNQPLLN